MRFAPLSLLCCASVLAGQTPPQQSGVVLRSTTRLVQVNVIVQDKQGRPVTGLQKEDFVLKDRGKTQEIRAFSVESKDKVYKPERPLPPNVFSNRIEQRSGAPGSVTVILLDGLNTKWGDQMTAADQVVKFLEQLQPQDRVALYGLARELRILHDYTNDSSRLLAALKNFRGLHTTVLGAAEPSMQDRINAAGSAEVMQPIAEGDDEMMKMQKKAVQGLLDLLEEEAIYNQDLRVRTTCKALEAIANHLSSVPGRKNLIWVSSSFPMVLGFMNPPGSPAAAGTIPPASQPSAARPVPGRWVNRGRSADAEGGHMVRIFGRDPKTYDAEVDRAVRALNNANLAVYPVDARGLSVDPGVSTNIGTMNVLASRTGGKAFYNTNDLKTSIREAIDDSSVTYTLAYYPSELNGDGRFRDIKVKVNRPGVTVRYRKGYFDLPEADLQDPNARDAALRDALWSPLDATGVRMDARLDFLEKPEPSLRIHIAMDPASVTLQTSEGRHHGRVQLLLAQMDEKGQECDVISRSLVMNMEQATFQSILKTGIICSTTIARKPNAASLRIVVSDDASGNIGSVTVPFNKVVNDGI